MKRNDSRFTCEELSDVSFRPLLTRELLAEEAGGPAEEEEGEGVLGEEGEGRAEEEPALAQQDIIQIGWFFKNCLPCILVLHNYILVLRSSVKILN